MGLLRSAAAGALLGLLLLAAPGEARAFCRTTTTPIPASYSPTRGCFTDGLFLFWRNACVSYSLNQDGTSRVTYEEAASVIDASFATWTTAACASGNVFGLTLSSRSPVAADQVRYNNDSPNQNLIVFREAEWPYSDPNNTLGLTTVTFDSTTGEIFDADMEINATGKNLTVGDPVPATGYDLQSVVTHEVGHFLGLAHATDRTATMYASYKPGSIALRTLTPDDVAGACAIYPNAAAREVSPSVAPNGELAAEACNDEPRHGFGTTNFAPPPELEKSSSGCVVARGDASSIDPSALGAVALGLVVARRLRTRRRG